MASPETYEWDELVGSASHIKIWHPNAVVDPLCMPGLQPHSVPPYGLTESIPQPPTRKREYAAYRERIDQIRTTIVLGQAALHQSYAEYTVEPMSERLMTNITLMHRVQDFSERTMVRIFPFSKPLPVGATAPFMIYERGDETTVVARDVDNRIHFSTHPDLVAQKSALFDQLLVRAGDQFATESLIRKAVQEQRLTDTDQLL